MSRTLRGLMIVGTDTGVGKTWVTSLAARQLRQEGHRIGIYKPACSGSEPTGRASSPAWPDLLALAEALGVTDPDLSLMDRICPQRFHAPVAPPVAAMLEQRVVDEPLLYAGIESWRGEADLLLVEGVGGLLCPLTPHSTIADFAVRIGFPVLVVARLGLGTINHTLLTLEAAERRGLDVRGILLNESEPCGNREAAATNPLEIAVRTSVPVLGVIRHGTAMVEEFDLSFLEKRSRDNGSGRDGFSGDGASVGPCPDVSDLHAPADLSANQLHEKNKRITINWLQFLGAGKLSGANDGL